MRGISTVVDVTIFLLLVSASVATLAMAPDPDTEPVVVDDRADLLAATTADVEYTLGTADRRAHGTVASLLARAAVANATVDGTPLSSRHGDFIEEVSNVSRTTLGPTNRTQVLVRWEPYRGGPVRGTVRVGADPPRGRDVTVATLSVPGPAWPSRRRAGIRAREAGFRGVASVAARATAAALLPSGHATIPSARVSPASVAASSRLSTLGEATGVSVTRPLDRGNRSAARERVVSGLTSRYERDMRERFDTPREAADALKGGRVTITVRRWES